MEDRTRFTTKIAVFLVAFAFLATAGCTMISGYDPTSYKTATDLKVESTALIDLAADPPSKHEEEISDLWLKLRKAYEYEKGKGKNTETVEQWKLMIDENSGLMGEFIVKWQSEGTAQSEPFRKGMKKNVSAGFDQIIRLENGKVKK